MPDGSADHAQKEDTAGVYSTDAHARNATDPADHTER